MILRDKIAARHGGGHLGDVANLRGQVAGHRVDVVGQVLPGAGDAGHLRLAAQLALGADLARDARDLAGETVELIDHGVQRFLQLKDLAAHIDGDLARQVAAGDRGRHLGDVAHLAVRLPAIELTLSVRSFQVPATPGHLRLAAQPPFGADLARDAGHFAGERVELVDHRVDGLLQLQDFAATR